ncbi:MAG: glycine oxidase ThiO, partial [Gemmatimonadetes bacterium]|nr:glycine oxidase ThiO [Gemmatimonadota bacterium]
GMLAPLGEAPGPGPFLAFALESLGLWEGWAEQLRQRTGSDVGYVRCGKLLVARDGDAHDLRARARWQREEGHDVAWLEGAGVRTVEAALAPEWGAGLHLPDHARVDPRRLAPALEEAVRASGVDVRTGVEVRSLVRSEDAVTGVELADGKSIEADTVVLAAGAWSGGISGLPRRLPLRPIKGQMLSLALDRPILGGLVAGPGAYLIPREDPDGPLMVVGATMEDAGFDTATDGSSIDGLRSAAEALVPALAGRPERERWAGLRPALPDGLPLIGPDPELDGLVYATGHHRNGILLAPVTARVVAGALSGGPPDSRWAAFGPARFP